MSAADEAYDRLHGLDGHVQAACSDCGHRHTPSGCAGPPTPSDRWAGVSPAVCDCADEAPDSHSVEAGREMREAEIVGTIPAGDWGRMVERALRAEAERDEWINNCEEQEMRTEAWITRAEEAEAKVAMVAGLLAAYGDAEGTPVDYEFLVHHTGEAIK